MVRQHVGPQISREPMMRRFRRACLVITAVTLLASPASAAAKDPIGPEVASAVDDVNDFFAALRGVLYAEWGGFGHVDEPPPPGCEWHKQWTNNSCNLWYLRLQQRMQDESRRFTIISNVMWTKHDTVKNSISNVR